MNEKIYDIRYRFFDKLAILLSKKDCLIQKNFYPYIFVNRKYDDC